MTMTAIDLAKSAVAKTGKSTKIIGSLPPLETSYRPDLILPEGEMLDYYSEIASMLKDQVDVIVCETMASGLEAKCALRATLNVDMEVWVSWTLHGNRPNILPSGESIQKAFAALVDLKPNAYLVNCCGANFVGQAINELKELTNSPIGGYANAENITVISEGVNLVDNAEDLQKQSCKEINEEEYATEVAKWIDNGASIVGGCCRTRPGYIKELRRLIDGME